MDIFNRVNSSVTILSQKDCLALGNLCASYPEAGDELKKRLRKWENPGYLFRIEGLLRCINTIHTAEAFCSDICFRSQSHPNIRGLYLRSGKILENSRLQPRFINFPARNLRNKTRNYNSAGCLHGVGSLIHNYWF